MNDAYAKDISKKVKSVLKSKKINGEFVGAFAPYGYKKSPDDNHKFVKDMETSYYVLLIFNSILKGKTSGEIANELNKRNILTPERILVSEVRKKFWCSNPFHYEVICSPRRKSNNMVEIIHLPQCLQCDFSL